MRKEARLHLFGDFQFLNVAALRFLPFSDGATFGFDGVGDFVEADERVDVVVGILEARENAAPDGGRFSFFCIGRMHLRAVTHVAKTRVDVEHNAAAAPLLKFREDVFGDESDLRVAADEFDLLRFGIRRDEGNIAGAVGRSDHGVGASGSGASVKDEMKAKLVDKKTEAAIEVVNKYGYGLKTKIRIFPVEPDRGDIGRIAREFGHGRDIIRREELVWARVKETTVECEQNEESYKSASGIE